MATLLAALDPTGLAWLDTGLAIAGSAAVLVLAWLLFPVAIAIALGFFADDVAEAVERRHYPDLPPPSGMGVSDSVWAALRFGAVALLLNLLVLPLVPAPRRQSADLSGVERLSARARVLRDGRRAPAARGDGRPRCAAGCGRACGWPAW